MLEKPDIPDAAIIDCLHDAFGLPIAETAFLPLGADSRTAVYRAVSPPGTAYFVKLRRDVFDEMTVLIPGLLRDQGVTQIIAPLATGSGQLWAELGVYVLAVYPFVAGHNGYEIVLTDQHWVEFGRALKGIHTAVLPPALADHLPRETYSPRWREAVRGFQAQIERDTFSDPAAAELAAFLKGKQREVSHLVNRAEQLSAVLLTRSLPVVLCHADIHAGNILIDEADGALYVVDWDTPVLAPKERDLMFPGGGLFANNRTPQDEETLFYAGYGQTPVNPVALAYYRYERIVQDIAAYCEQLLLSNEGGDDRPEGLRQLMSQFQPGAVIDIANRSEAPPPELRS